MQDEKALARGFSGIASADIDWHRRLQAHRIGEDVGSSGRVGHGDETATDHLTNPSRGRTTAPSSLIRTNKASFFLDDEIVEMDLEVDAFELPSFEDAERLLQSYMTSCHNSFPFLAKKAFTQQFYHCT